MWNVQKGKRLQVRIFFNIARTLTEISDSPPARGKWLSPGGTNNTMHAFPGNGEPVARAMVRLRGNRLLFQLQELTKTVTGIQAQMRQKAVAHI
jgi:hypothetical protein